VADDELSRAYETINIYRRNQAAVIELNRPASMNAWSDQFSLDLLDAVNTVAGDDDVRAVMVIGAGRAFSSGADLKEGLDRAQTGTFDPYGVLTERYHPIINGIRHMAKPVIAAVNGAAAGIGLSLALAADLVVAAESAYFTLAFVNIGLVPDGGSSVLVPSRIGFTRAAELALLGERLPATQARDWGLINRVYADDDFKAESNALLDRLANGPTRSYVGTKRQLNRWLYEQLDGQLEFEAGIQREMAGSADFTEGLASFTQKRPPRFTGA
jgi:2-(1,2-epoxy-1,2-dihydrophenyl)acetyl-CoA isomerase